MKIFITGVAGFIGYNLAFECLKDSNNKVYGIDSYDDYYSVNLKKKRIKNLKKNKNFFFSKTDICDYKKFENFVIDKKFGCSSWCKVFTCKPKKIFKSKYIRFFKFFKIINWKESKKNILCVIQFCLWRKYKLSFKGDRKVKSKKCLWNNKKNE